MPHRYVNIQPWGTRALRLARRGFRLSRCSRCKTWFFGRICRRCLARQEERLDRYRPWRSTRKNGVTTVESGGVRVHEFESSLWGLTSVSCTGPNCKFCVRA